MPLKYFVQDEPILDKQHAEGHAVRLLYLAAAVSKVGRLLNDQKMLDTAERLWTNIVKHRMYITGAVGSCQVGESFSFDDDLPNDLVYGETCASVAMLFYGKSLMETKPRGSVADVMEKELFNGVLSGVQLDGTRYFYVNPLEADPAASKGNPTKAHILTRRAGWFDCACCPANLGRLIASLDQYLYTVSNDGKTVYAHQFVANKTNSKMASPSSRPRPVTNTRGAATSPSTCPTRMAWTRRWPSAFRSGPRTIRWKSTAKPSSSRWSMVS